MTDHACNLQHFNHNLRERLLSQYYRGHHAAQRMNVPRPSRWLQLPHERR